MSDTNKRILIVEDNPDYTEMILFWLNGQPFTPVHATSGTEAVQLLETDGDFDALIVNFNIPGMDGVELLDWGRKRELDFPVIFTTASRPLLKKEEIALSDCCADILYKPFMKDQFMTALSKALARKHAVQCKPH